MKKRLFIGIPLPKNILNAIEEIEKNIESNLNWISIENLHITVIFLGWVEEEYLEKIYKALHQIKSEQFVLKITKIDFSPNNRMIWAYLKYAQKLIDLQKNLINFLKENNVSFQEEFREYLPHINLIRLETLYKKEIRINTNLEFKAEKINLYESILIKPQVEYKVLKNIKLN